MPFARIRHRALFISLALMLFGSVSALTHEEVLAQLAEASANRANVDLMRASLLHNKKITAEDKRQIRDDWVSEGTGGGNPLKNGMQINLDERSFDCEADEACSGHGKCDLGYCSWGRYEFITKEDCQAQTVCVRGSEDIDNGMVTGPMKDNKGAWVLQSELEDLESCEGVGVCKRATDGEVLPQLSNEEDCLSPTKNYYGICKLEGLIQSDYDHKEQDCLAAFGGTCFEKTEEEKPAEAEAEAEGAAEGEEGGEKGAEAEASVTNAPVLIPLVKFKTKKTCEEEGGGVWKHKAKFYSMKNEWTQKNRWMQAVWFTRNQCVCEKDYRGRNCEGTDGKVFLDSFKEEHGKKAIMIEDSLHYRVIKYGKKGSAKVPEHFRTPVELRYTERVAYSGEVAFASATADEPEKTTVMNARAAPLGMRSLLERMQVGDRVEAVVGPEIYYGYKGRGPICPTCSVVIDIELVAVRDDLRPPDFNYDVVHLGDAPNDAAEPQVQAYAAFRDHESDVEAKKAEGKDAAGIVAMFYSPQCPHSRNMMPVYAKAAHAYRDVVKFTAINCLKETQTCVENSVQSYPHIKYVKGDNLSMKFKFNRDEAGMNSFITNLQSGGTIPKTKKKKKIKKLKKKTKKKEEL